MDVQNTNFIVHCTRTLVDLLYFIPNTLKNNFKLPAFSSKYLLLFIIKSIFIEKSKSLKYGFIRSKCYAEQTPDVPQMYKSPHVLQLQNKKCTLGPGDTADYGAHLHPLARSYSHLGGASPPTHHLPHIRP